MSYWKLEMMNETQSMGIIVAYHDIGLDWSYATLIL